MVLYISDGKAAGHLLRSGPVVIAKTVRWQMSLLRIPLVLDVGLGIKRNNVEAIAN